MARYSYFFDVKYITSVVLDFLLTYPVCMALFSPVFSILACIICGYAVEIKLQHRVGSQFVIRVLFHGYYKSVLKSCLSWDELKLQVLVQVWRCRPLSG